ncbi:ROK family glucokinase [Shouchella shacheensis]|uniref:ROK family glucokinase n=1 Tax=Shouchella shacheensis TaxID=1649580 RepID=UPI00073FCF49|nr:ROK family glucokinase [Shouchella shacheensis]
MDIGGTSVKLAFLTGEGELLKKWEIPTNRADEGRHVAKEIAASIRENLEEGAVIVGAGVGAPGFIELETGFIYHAVNIGWRDYPLREELEVELGVGVKIDNDANLAALGEKWRGAGDGSDEVLFVTLGTGVGGGIITNGEILHGASGMGGEIGHITSVFEGGAPCNCGNFGCLETVSSATGIVRLAKEALDQNRESTLHTLRSELTTKAVFDACDQGDELAKGVVQQAMTYLGIALANLSNALNPRKIVIGGGVSKAGETLLSPLREVFEHYALPRVAESAEFKIAHLGNDAGIYGAVWIAKEAREQRAGK